MRSTIIVLVLLSLVIPAYGQAQNPVGPNLNALLTGKVYPLTIQLKQMDPTWIVFDSSDLSGEYGYSWAYSMYEGVAASGYFTKGDTADLGGQTYLVAYAPKPKPVDDSVLGRYRRHEPQKLTLDTTFGLCLLNTKSISRLTNIRPLKIDDEVAASAAQIKAMERYTREGEEPGSSESRLKQLAYAAHVYMSEHDDKLPTMQTFEQFKTALKPYVESESVFLEPETKQPYAANPTLSDHKLSQIQDPTQMVLFYERSPGEAGSRVVAFLDAHVESVSASDWEKLKKASKIP